MQSLLKALRARIVEERPLWVAELAALRAMPPRCQPEWQPVGDWLEDEAS